jgi:hypothetical protein
VSFSFKATAKGTVFIERDGERVTTLRGDRARRFLAMVHSTDIEGQQQLMARATGNYKRGNERHSSEPGSLFKQGSSASSRSAK